MSLPAPRSSRIDPALVVVLAGVCAALHVGKLPPAIPVLRDALGIATVSFCSAMLTARSFAARHGYAINANHEFVALGVSNLAAGMSQGFAISGADSRTAVNDANGGKSQLVSIIAAAVIADRSEVVRQGNLGLIPPEIVGKMVVGVVLVQVTEELVKTLFIRIARGSNKA